MYLLSHYTILVYHLWLTVPANVDTGVKYRLPDPRVLTCRGISLHHLLNFPVAGVVHINYVFLIQLLPDNGVATCIRQMILVNLCCEATTFSTAPGNPKIEQSSALLKA
jgi:hypothetical protein